MYLYVSDCFIIRDLLSYDRYLNIKILRNNYVCFHIFLFYILSVPIYIYIYVPNYANVFIFFCLWL